MTYNVHSCIGQDGKLSVERIAEVIDQSEPDIIALQELDAGRMKRGTVNQAEQIAECLEMEFHHFHPVYGSGSESFGNAVLSRFPLQWRQAELLPRSGFRFFFEERGALWVEVDLHGKSLHVITTHLSLWTPERHQQIRWLMSDKWLANPSLEHQSAVLCGDFNMTPNTLACRTICRKFKDTAAGKKSAASGSLNTWTSRWPLRRLDYIFIKGKISARDSHVPKNDLAAMASDHLPYVADLEFQDFV